MGLGGTWSGGGHAPYRAPGGGARPWRIYFTSQLTHVQLSPHVAYVGASRVARRTLMSLMPFIIAHVMTGTCMVP